MKRITLLLMIAASLNCLSCRSSKKSAQQPPEVTHSEVVKPSIASGNQKIENMNTPAIKRENLNMSMIDFAFRFYRFQSEAKGNENICVSPVSLQIALGMTYAGAKNLTAKEMSDVLGFSEDMNLFLKEMSVYHQHLKSAEENQDITFSLANRIYVEQTYKLLEAFMSDMDKHFGGSFEVVDFMNNPREAEKIINKWVETVTNERIKQLIPDGMLKSSTLMVLVNAIYFKSQWKYAFDEELTEEMGFYAGERGRVERMFMKGELKNIRYAAYKQWQVLELPYVTEDFSFLVVLPNKSTATDLNTRIPDGDDYLEMLSMLSPHHVYVELPKFKVESAFELEKMMAQMGMPLAFTDDADFSGMSGKRDIKIDKILQKVFFEITEKGSEAAAATAVVMVRITSVSPGQDREPIRFIANRPFIFILKENKYNTPLFIGQYVGKE